jgi:two-component system, chemotaxis family, chemotaxis protein CheY
MAFDRSITVLVVDDHDTTLRFVRTLLRQLGFVSVDDANNVAEALTKMRLRRYGLVISDWHTKPVTGCDFLREVRGDPSLKRTPFLMIGESKSETVIAAKKAGVNSYIVKPFSAQTLKAKIEAAFATRTAPLRERRQALTSSQSPQSSEAEAVVATPTSSAATRLKVDGLFTGSL